VARPLDPQSYYDPPLVGVALPRMLIYTPRASLKTSWFYRIVTRGLDLEPVARDGRDVGAARRMIERVRDGEVLVLFPEQTRTRDGSLGTISPGFHMIAAHAPAPVLPVLRLDRSTSAGKVSPVSARLCNHSNVVPPLRRAVSIFSRARSSDC
jgi:1-acyl-sn-glycerol-3-phosphate acyltransferase